MCMSAQMSEEPRGTGYPGDEVTGGCEQSNMGGGDPTPVFFKSSLCSQLPRRFETWSCYVTWLSGNHRAAHSNCLP